MAAVRVVDGWVKVPFAGKPFDSCFLAFGDRRPDENTKWLPAFRDFDGRRRVLQVRQPAAMGTVTVWSSVNGTIAREGTVRL